MNRTNLPLKMTRGAKRILQTDNCSLSFAVDDELLYVVCCILTAPMPSIILYQCHGIIGTPKVLQRKSSMHASTCVLFSAEL